jgi:hypothetical protein
VHAERALLRAQGRLPHRSRAAAAGRRARVALVPGGGWQRGGGPRRSRGRGPGRRGGAQRAPLPPAKKRARAAVPEGHARQAGAGKKGDSG